MKIITANIIKGGCGKTTSVQIIGEILSKIYGKKVLCVDTDPQANLTLLSGIDMFSNQEHNLFTLLYKNDDINDCIQKTKYYDIIPGEIHLAYIESLLGDSQGKEYAIKNVLEGLDYDYILIDTPSALGMLNIMSMTASTDVIIPAETSYPAASGMDMLVGTIQSVQKHSNSDLRAAGVFLIKYHEENENDRNIYNKVRHFCNTRKISFCNPIDEDPHIKDAQTRLDPIIDFCPDSIVIKKYKDIINYILKE